MGFLEEEEKTTLAECFKKLILRIFTKIKQVIKNIFSLECISKMCIMYWGENIFFQIDL